MFLSISRSLREQVKLMQRRKGNWDNKYCIEFPCLMKSTREHYGLLQTRLFHWARWSGWLSAPQCSTIMVKFYEKLWLLKKITIYWHLKFFLLIAPKRGWHLCNRSPTDIWIPLIVPLLSSNSNPTNRRPYDIRIPLLDIRSARRVHWETFEILGW